MPRFVILANFTDQGIHAAKDTLDRASVLENLADKMGCRLESIDWTLGSHDVVVRMEAPDDHTATALLLTVCSQGNVRTQTLRAFDRTEMSDIIHQMS